MPTRPLDWATRPFGIFRNPDLRRHGRWILTSTLIGAVSGVGAILFDLVFRLSQRLLLEGIGGFRPPAPGFEGGAGYPPQNPWLLPVSLGVGGLIAGALVYGWAPEAEGHGTDAVIRAFHHLRGRIRRRVPIVKGLASAVTIGSGGSGGREGPIAQIGAGFGSFLADVLHLRNRDRRVLMMAGVAGGIGSIFRAPLGAALFSAEVLYREPEFEYEVLIPGLLAAITGYSLYSSYAGWGYLFEVPRIAFHEPRHLALYALLGVVCGLAGMVFPRVFYGFRDRVFRPLPLPVWLKPAAGALALGGIAVVYPEALGMGYGYIQEAIQGGRAAGHLLLFGAVKMVATSLTISSGGSGGVFGPSLVIGGALGAAFGEAAARAFPPLAPDPVACILVGMGGFFAGVARVPFASVIMVMEMTGSYGLLVPSLLVAAVAYLFVPPRVGLYENQVASRIDSPAHQGAFAVDVLRLARIADGWEPQSVTYIRTEQRVGTALEAASRSTQNLFPVVDAAGGIAGEISIDDLRRALLAHPGADGPPAGDVMHPVVGPLAATDTLEVAARILAGRQTDGVIVLGDPETGPVRGIYTRRDLIVAYGRAMSRIRDPERPDLPDPAPHPDPPIDPTRAR